MEDYLKISHLIQNDHQQINKLYQVKLFSIHFFKELNIFLICLKNYSISRGNIDDQQRWSNQIQQQLMAYLNTEETILYPFILQHFQLNIDLFIQQHQQVLLSLLRLLFLLYYYLDEKTLIFSPYNTNN